MEIQLLLPKNKYPARRIAIILCAGKGTRIKNIFPSIPKPLIKIQRLEEELILNQLISNLLDLKIDQIEIIIGHLGSQIEDHIRSIKRNGKKDYTKVSIIDSGQEYKKGSLFSFLSFSKNLAKYFSRDLFLLFPGDTIFSKELLKSIFNLISEKGALFRKSPSIFYHNTKRDDLMSDLQHPISILETFSENNEFFLEKIVQVDIRSQNRDIIKQVVPILSFPYKFIIKMVNEGNKRNITSIRDMINFLIESKNQRFMVHELSSKDRFYDIDSEKDLINFEKKDGQ
ncbi:MAG: hypothetical protein EU516_00375 [Promethearchaeota archaeon]|nr:MAG: hypothetical protein EU516_00375 [Candidatus Lokiarchaeota archaeon]